MSAYHFESFSMSAYILFFVILWMGWLSQPEEAVERVVATGEDPMRIKLDKAGYFVVNVTNQSILVEHYSYQEKLLRTIEGYDARSIYLTIVRNGWVSKLDHAAYIGKELSKAELSIRYEFDYLQDGG